MIMSEAFPLQLASASPRRRELLRYLGVPFTLSSNDAEEEAHVLPPAELLAELPPLGLPQNDHPTLRAWRKAAAACIDAPGDGIIGADTIVVLDGDVLNKPRDAADARAMLRRLAHRMHTVYTGVTLIVPDTAVGAYLTFFALEQSDVMIAPLDDATIAAYVATGEPLDKAGAYGIQGLGGQLVQAVHGSYTNVVGLPLGVVYNLLRRAGYAPPTEPAEAYRTWLRDQQKEPLPCPPTLP